MEPPASQETILCVDDELTGLNYRKLILEQQGYCVFTADNPIEALEVFKRHPVDLVITDHLLGRSTGTTMAAEMKRLKPSVPIIILSGTTDLPNGIENADLFLSKTEGPEELITKTKLVLEKLRCGSTTAPLGSRPDTLQALLAAIVEGSDDAILSKTLDGTVMTWNKAAEKMYGYTAAEIIGRPVSILLPPDRPDEVRQILKRLQKGEPLDHLQTRRMTKDGRILSVSLTISPIRDKNGHIVGASTIARDVTHTRMAEEALRSTEKLAVAGRMAATVAHEINNPLEAVNNILFLLARSPNLPQVESEYVLAAQEELRRVSEITRLTLGFYREKDEKRSAVNIQQLLDSILSLYSRKITSLQLSMSRRYEAQGEVYGSAGELRQVFSNLIVNAFDALQASGSRLVIHVWDSRDFRDPSQRGVRVSISDDGAGIPSHTQRRLFEPFFTTKGGKGTGIGLWVSRGIVEKHGGHMQVHSRTAVPNSGTTFMVFLPSEVGLQQAA